jgi:Tfp pilus assembly protein PilF
MRFAHTLTLVLALTPFAAAQKPSPEQLLQSAKTAQQDGDLPAAIRDYRLLLEMRPTLVEARVNLGSALAESGQYDAAIEQFQAALPHTRAKQQPTVHFAIGLAYFREGDLPSAKQELTQVLETQPNNIPAATLLGECDLKLDNPTSALAVYSAHSALAYQDMDFAYFYGVALIRSGRLNDGAQMVQKVADAASGPEVFQLTGVAYLLDGGYDAARRDLELARRLNPALPNIDLQVGMARERVGDTFAAEAAFRDALRLQPMDADANLYLGSILLKLRKVKEATPLLERALQHAASDSAASARAAALRSAIDELHQAAAQDPSWTEPHAELIADFDKLRFDNEATQERVMLERLAIQPHEPVSKPQQGRR